MPNHSNLSTPAAVHGAVVPHIDDGSAAPAAYSRNASRQPGLAALPRRQRGMAMLEYIILAALLAIGTISVVQHFGGAIRDQFAGLTKEIAGQDSSDNRDNAKARAEVATTQAATNRTLGNYGKGITH